MHDQNRVFVSPFALQTALRTASQEEVIALYENNTGLIERWPWLKAEFEEAQSVGGDVNAIRERHLPTPPDRSRVSDLQPGEADPCDLSQF